MTRVSSMWLLILEPVVTNTDICEKHRRISVPPLSIARSGKPVIRVLKFMEHRQ